MFWYDFQNNVMKVHYVFCEVGNEFLNVVDEFNATEG
jgi:hypothetical protein